MSANTRFAPTGKEREARKGAEGSTFGRRGGRATNQPAELSRAGGVEPASGAGTNDGQQERQNLRGQASGLVPLPVQLPLLVGRASEDLAAGGGGPQGGDRGRRGDR